jgi:hypothetical protein
MDTHSNCNELAARFEKMAADGLLDVKFSVRNSDEATADAVCKEVLSLYEAVGRGEETDLDFKDTTAPAKRAFS